MCSALPTTWWTGREVVAKEVVGEVAKEVAKEALARKETVAVAEAVQVAEEVGGGGGGGGGGAGGGTCSSCASLTIAQKMNWSLVCSASRLSSIASRHACTKAFEPLVARKKSTPVFRSERSPHPTPGGGRERSLRVVGAS